MKLARAFSPAGKLCQASLGSYLVSVFFCFAYMRRQIGALAEIPVARAEISAAFS